MLLIMQEKIFSYRRDETNLDVGRISIKPNAYSVLEPHTTPQYHLEIGSAVSLQKAAEMPGLTHGSALLRSALAFAFQVIEGK